MFIVVLRNNIFIFNLHKYAMCTGQPLFINIRDLLPLQTSWSMWLPFGSPFGPCGWASLVYWREGSAKLISSTTRSSILLDLLNVISSSVYFQAFFYLFFMAF